MAAPAVAAPNLEAQLRAPFGWRPLMAAWNTMFHRAAPFVPTPGRSALWNRGAYLVEGLGHCSACHSPRNALGAELDGAGHLAGGEVEGWYAPPLNGVSPAPIAWTEQAYFDYLRTGHSAEHGAAGGPMAPIVAELAGAPDEDIRAMAHYLASLAPPAPAADLRKRPGWKRRRRRAPPIRRISPAPESIPAPARSATSPDRARRCSA